MNFSDTSLQPTLETPRNPSKPLETPSSPSCPHFEGLQGVLVRKERQRGLEPLISIVMLIGERDSVFGQHVNGHLDPGSSSEIHHGAARLSDRIVSD